MGWRKNGGRIRLFINPPFTRGIINQFADKLLAHILDGSVKEAVWLANFYSDSQWFHDLAAAAVLIFLPRRRIEFWRPGGE